MPRLCKAVGITQVGQKLGPLSITRRDVAEDDVLIKIQYCGICHSDIHTIREEWDPIELPCVVGHEIVGAVEKVGSKVVGFQVGDIAGVGCYVDSCRECNRCRAGFQQHCKPGTVYTYAKRFKYPHSPDYTPDGGNVTLGGYSEYIVVQYTYVLSIPPALQGAKLPAAAPLLCAGITTYSPLKRYGLSPKHRFGVVGLGGLGHMAVKFGKAFGAHTTVISRGTKKSTDALALGADAYLDSTNAEAMKNAQETFDIIINTVSGPHDVMAIIKLLDFEGTMVMVGGLPELLPVKFGPFVDCRRRLEGSLIGGISETQDMLNFCAENNIVCDIEMVTPDKVNEAYERVVSGDVHYRFVIDINAL